MSSAGNGAGASDNDLIVKAPVAGRCESCGAEELRRYAVLSAGGWFEVVKCQRCLRSKDRRPWRRLGWVTLPEDVSWTP